MRLGYLVLPPALVPAFRQAKRSTDRHAPLLEQRVLASLIESGAYERHVRRIRRENERRRTALLEAIARHLPDDTRVEGSAAGLHVVVWFPRLPQSAEPALIEAARRRGVGVHTVSGLFARSMPHQGTTPAGRVVGYASLTTEQIRLGIGVLSEALADLPSAGRTSRTDASRTLAAIGPRPAIDPKPPYRAGSTDLRRQGRCSGVRRP